MDHAVLPRKGRKGQPFLVTFFVLLVCVGVAISVSIAYVYHGDNFNRWLRSLREGDTDRMELAEFSGPSNPGAPMLLNLPGRTKPRTIPAEDAQIGDDEEILGVVVEGTARAYSIGVLASGPDRHVVNDLIHEVPVSVTYCVLSSCGKAFTSPTRGKPLDVGVGGLVDNQMLLLIGEQRFYQASLDPFQTDPPRQGTVASVSPFPYQVFPVRRMKWKAWKEAYPDTDVYVGEMH